MKKIRRTLFIFAFLVIIFVGYVMVSTPIKDILGLPSVVSVTYDALNEINLQKKYGKFVRFCYDDTVKTGTTNGNGLVIVKLLNFITLKTLKIGLNSNEVYVGGNTVGFSLNSKGVVLIGHSDIVTKEGKVDTLQGSKLEVGDIITKINNEEVSKVSDISRVIKDIKDDKEIVVNIIKNGKEEETTIKPALDIYTQSYKLGIWVKDETSGVGTLTYIKKEDGSFGALGHAICDGETNLPFNVKDGDMFPCQILGVNKGQKGKPGEVKALFLQKNRIGQVKKNSKFGIYGSANLENDYFKDKTLFSTGGRLTARAGKAKIRSDVSGQVKEYDVEIIKTNYQNSSNEKSMVIKVTDKALLKLTGGIVQGMSGSPIIQNGKIIGAVTHVFVNDSTKGFGIYLDWMINE